MNSTELLKKLRQIGPVEFVNNVLFDGFAWFCPTLSGDEYEDVRMVFGEVFNVPATDVAIVGSGKYGFSMSPKKNFRMFQPDIDASDPSDLDLVIISKAIFNSTWHNLRKADYNGAVDARKYFQEDIFRRFIMLGTNEFNDTKYLRDLNLLLDRVRKTASTRFGIVQTIKVRIYSSWSDAKSYHIWSAQRLGEQHGIQ